MDSLTNSAPAVRTEQTVAPVVPVDPLDPADPVDRAAMATVVPVDPTSEAVEREWAADEEEVAKTSPFAALASLKKN